MKLFCSLFCASIVDVYRYIFCVSVYWMFHCICTREKYLKRYKCICYFCYQSCASYSFMLPVFYHSYAHENWVEIFLSLPCSLSLQTERTVCLVFGSVLIISCLLFWLHFAPMDGGGGVVVVVVVCVWLCVCLPNDISTGLRTTFY